MAKTLRRLPGGRTILQAALGDATGVVDGVWFNQAYLANQLKVGDALIVYGRLEPGRRPQLIHPEIERLDEEVDEALLHTGRIVPIYPLTQGLGQRWLRRLVSKALTESAQTLPEVLPADILSRQRLPGVRWAIEQLHFPESLEAAGLARRRLAFEELFVMQVRLALRRQALTSRQKPQRYQINGLVTAELIRRLPFSLTAGQQRVLEELREDLGRPAPMLRLLQGEVGCGKTIVAVLLIATAAPSGYQAAVMAPTELLAEQHHRVLSRYLEPLGVSVRLLAQGVSPAERSRIIQEAAEGHAAVLVGTHALLLGPQGRLRGCPCDDGHAHPQDAGAVALRRPSSVHRHGAAAGPPARPHSGGGGDGQE
jgi:ATP-dependent DNA helicase RecG